MNSKLNMYLNSCDQKTDYIVNLGIFLGKIKPESYFHLF